MPDENTGENPYPHTPWETEEAQTKILHQKKGQDSQVRLESEQRYVQSQNTFKQLEDEKEALSAVFFSEKIVLIVRGSLKAAEETNEYLLKKRGEDIVKLCP